MLHDINGINPDMARIASRFAEAGYVALVPDLFDGKKSPLCVVKTVRSIAAGSGPAHDIVDQAQTWLRSQPGVASNKVGAVGFCMGGGFAVLHARGPDVAFVATFYGEVPEERSDLEDIAPCFGGYGTQDRLFIKHGRRLKTRLEELGTPHDVRIYDNVGHSYMNQLTGVLGKAVAYSPMRARFDQSASEDSWAAMLEFFDAQLNPQAI